MDWRAFLAAVLALVVASKAEGLSDVDPQYVYKHLAGPASEFMPPPKPRDAAVTSHVRFLPAAQLAPAGGNSVYKTSFLADGELAFSLAIICATDNDLKHLKIVLTSPSGVVAEPIKVADGPFGIDGHTYASRGLVYAYAEKGQWVLEINLEPGLDTLVKVFPMVAFTDAISVTVSADTVDTLVGNTVTLTAEVDQYEAKVGHEEQQDGVGDQKRMRKASRRLGLNNGVTAVFVELRDPSGKVVEEKMEPKSGVNSEALFTAPVRLEEAGSYQAVVLVRGNHLDGEAFERSAYYWINAVEKSASLTGEVVVKKEANEFTADELFSVNLMLDASVKSESRFRVYAEIYSTKADAANPTVPTAWISGLSDVQQVNNKPALTLNLNSAWLSGFSGPYDLLNVRVEEIRTYSTVTSASRMALPLPAETIERLAKSERRPITREMREGFHLQRRKKSREESLRRGNVTAPQENKLILVHGYCSKVTPYSLEDFTNYVVFQDFGKSRPNDDFARLIVDTGREYSSFGAIGHSQGGVALLHMSTYYSTGLDEATGGRRLQTLASPYGGTPLSGLLAVIGDFFGLGCGDNQDLSYDSMSKWIAAIPVAKRNDVYYYTSQYATGSLINYCLLPSNLVLSWPNDGVVEDKATPLPGGHFIEHTKGECHSDGMNSPPICKNHSRNQLLNSLASR